jgi:hypothetical protein
MTTTLAPAPPRRFEASAVRPVSHDGVRQLLLAYRSAKYGAVIPHFELLPGMIYTKVRAISARINQNWDAWPSEELKKSYKTFLGKPVFVNHNNFDPTRARGRVVASQYIEKDADKYIEVIQEVDGVRFPKLAHEIRTGGMDSVSMGVEAGFTICSYCGNRATDVWDMCDHVKFHKGTHLPDPRTGQPRLVFEHCYKLGFFELSYVFDPADETAVVNQVVVANKKAWKPMSPGLDAYMDWVNDAGTLVHPDSAEEYIQSYRPENPDEIREFAHGQGGKAYGPPERHHMKRPARRRQAWGETEAPEDIDTLREDDDDSDDDYEFVTPYRPRDEEDSPFQHYLESPEELQTPDFDQTKRLDRAQEQEGLDADRLVEDVEEVGTLEGPEGPEGQDPQAGQRPQMARKTRRNAMARNRYAAEEDEDRRPPWLRDDDSEDRDEDRDHDEDRDEEDDDRDDDDDDRDEDHDDEDRDDDRDHDEEDRRPPQFESRRRRPRQGRRYYADDDKDDDDSDDKDRDDDDKDDDDKPPWLKGKESRRRRPVNPRSSRQKGRKKGSPMGATLAERGQVVASRQRRHFRADDSGNTDGGPYGRNDLGEQAETFIPAVFGEGDGVPPAEKVEAPAGDEPKESNTESNLVASIAAKTRSLKADLNRYQRLKGRRLHAEEGVEDPKVVNPELSGTDDQSLKGDDFQDTGLSDTETHPTDGDRSAARARGDDESRQWFAAFDSWLTQATGKPWQYHTSAALTRAAARWANGTGIALDRLFPTLETALRQARKGEAERKAMNRTAEGLDEAAPDARVDVEKPVSDETNDRAQASQFDLGEFGHNAGDDLADPEMSSDSQIWAPGKEGRHVRMADGVTAVRCAEAYIRMRMASPEDKWKLAGWLQTIRHATVVDRTNLLEAAFEANRRSLTAKRTPAGISRGAVRSIPPGLTSGGRTASFEREAAYDRINDSAIFM